MQKSLVDTAHFPRPVLMAHQVPQHFLDVLSDEIGFKVDLIANLQPVYGGFAGRMRDNVHIELTVTALIYRKADAIYRNGTLLDDVSCELTRCAEEQPHGSPLRASIPQSPDSVHVTAHQMPSQRVSHAKGPLEVESAAGRFPAEGGPA